MDCKNIDLIICEFISAAPVLFHLRSSGYTGPALIINHFNPYPVRNFLQGLLLTQCLNDNNLMVVGSETLSTRLKEVLDFKCVVMPTYGIDTSIFKKFDKGVSRKMLSLPDEFTVLYTGRFSPDKNIEGLLSTFKTLKNEGIRFSPILATHFRNTEYYFSLKVKLDNVIHFENMPRDKLPYLYSAADLFVTFGTSYNETFGRSPLEALACGCEVLVPFWVGFADNIPNPERFVKVDYLNTPLDDSISYAQASAVDMVKKIENVIKNISGNGPATVLNEKLKFDATRKRFQTLIDSMLQKNDNKAVEMESLKIPGELAQSIVNDLGIGNLNHLFELCTNDVEISLKPQVLKNLYYSLYYLDPVLFFPKSHQLETG